MSTKIHNGYKLPCMTMLELSIFMEKVKIKINDLMLIKLEDVMSEIMVHRLDILYLFGIDELNNRLKDNEYKFRINFL